MHRSASLHASLPPAGGPPATSPASPPALPPAPSPAPSSPFRSLLALPLLVLLSAGASACSDDGDLTGVVAEPPAPASIQVDPPSITFGSPGETLALSVTVRDTEGNLMQDAQVGFTSSSPAVAAVDGAGLVTAVGVGTATIELTLGELSADVGVTVEEGEVGGG